MDGYKILISNGWRHFRENPNEDTCLEYMNTLELLSSILYNEILQAEAIKKAWLENKEFCRNYCTESDWNKFNHIIIKNTDRILYPDF